MSAGETPPLVQCSPLSNTLDGLSRNSGFKHWHIRQRKNIRFSKFLLVANVRILGDCACVWTEETWDRDRPPDIQIREDFQCFGSDAESRSRSAGIDWSVCGLRWSQRTNVKIKWGSLQKALSLAPVSHTDGAGGNFICQVGWSLHVGVVCYKLEVERRRFHDSGTRKHNFSIGSITNRNKDRNQRLKVSSL